LRSPFSRRRSETIKHRGGKSLPPPSGERARPPAVHGRDAPCGRPGGASNQFLWMPETGGAPVLRQISAIAASIQKNT